MRKNDKITYDKDDSDVVKRRHISVSVSVCLITLMPTSKKKSKKNFSA